MFFLETQFRQADRQRVQVCFLVRALSGGGAQRDAILLANGLAAAGIVSAVATLDAEGPLGGLMAPEVALFDLGKGRKLRMALAVPELARFLNEERPEVIVASEAAGNCLAVLARRLVPGPSGTKVVLREVASPLAASRQDAYLQNRLGYRLAPWLYPQADLVTTFTTGARTELLAHFGLPPGKAVNLATNAVLTAGQLQTLSAAPDCSEPDLIVSVGRLSREKDHRTLLDAFAALCRTHAMRLVIAGEGRERAALERQIRTLGLDGRVTLAGFVADPLSLLRRAAVFVSASRHEGLGNALIEALACGVRVVATDAPHGPREILMGGRLGALVPVGDSHALTKAMADALQRPAPGDALRARAADFTVERATRRFAAVLADRKLLRLPLPFHASLEAPDDRFA